MNEEEATKPITLKATAQESETALVISYEVQNRTDQQLYLWDLMVGFNASSGTLIAPGAVPGGECLCLLARCGFFTKDLLMFQVL